MRIELDDACVDAVRRCMDFHEEVRRLIRAHHAGEISDAEFKDRVEKIEHSERGERWAVVCWCDDAISRAKKRST